MTQQHLIDAVDAILERQTHARPALFERAGVVDAMQSAYESDWKYGVSDSDAKAMLVAALRAIREYAQ